MHLAKDLNVISQGEIQICRSDFIYTHTHTLWHTSRSLWVCSVMELNVQGSQPLINASHLNVFSNQVVILNRAVLTRCPPNTHTHTCVDVASFPLQTTDISCEWCHRFPLAQMNDHIFPFPNPSKSLLLFCALTLTQGMFHSEERVILYLCSIICCWSCCQPQGFSSLYTMCIVWQEAEEDCGVPHNRKIAS